MLVTQSFEFETVTLDREGREIEHRTGVAQAGLENLGGEVVLEMVSIPGGIFQMGSPARMGYADEHPMHPVSVRPFWIARYPVTQQQWLAVMRKPLPFRCPGSHRPVERASWFDAQSFCKKLAGTSGRPYRLPSEAEWEYACRAGTGSPFSCGATLTTGYANYVGEHTFDLEPKGIYRHGTTDVGSFLPNPFGLSDMHGNVWEWCADAWIDDYTGAPPVAAVREKTNAEERVVRGGSWHETPNHCRSAVRLRYKSSERDDYVGFRLALTL